MTSHDRDLNSAATASRSHMSIIISLFECKVWVELDTDFVLNDRNRTVNNSACLKQLGFFEGNRARDGAKTKIEVGL